MIELEALGLLAGGGSAALLTLLAARRNDQQQRDRRRVEVSLRFPADLTNDQAAEALGHLVGHARRRNGLLGIGVVVLEVVADHERIEHLAVVEARRVGGVRSHLGTSVPGLRLDKVARGPVDSIRAASELRLTNWQRPLRVGDPAAASRAVLASLRPLRKGEQVVVQYVLVPAPDGQPATRQRPARAVPLVKDITSQLRDAGDVQAAKLKQSAPLYWMALRVGAVAGHAARARQLVTQTVAALASTSAPGVRLVRRGLPEAIVRRAIERRTTPWAAFPILLNQNELLALVAWPLDSPAIHGLDLITGRRLAPASSIPTRGRVIAMSNYPGQARPLAQAPQSVLHHSWVVGPTGSGKSHLLTNLILQDITASDRRSVVVIDAKADLVEAVLDRLPTHRHDDIVIIDAANDRPVGLNPLTPDGRDAEIVADQLFGVMRKLWKLESAPRTSDLLHVAILSLAHVPGMTLVELVPLLTNPAFRRQVVGRHAADPVLGPFWSAFEAMSDGERSQVIAPTLTRMRQFLLRSSLRAVLGQARPAISVAEAINGGKIVLVPLGAGRIGSESAALLGAVLLAELWIATQARATVPPERRRLTSIYVDEWQLVSHLPTDMADVLAQSRAFRVGYTLANQSPTQLSPSLREAVSTNARTKISFATSAGDAASLAKDFGPSVKAADLQGLGRHEVMVGIAFGSVTAPPATGVTLPLPDPTGQAEVVQARAAERYGQPRSDVEAAIRERLGHEADPGTPGRRRRQT